MLAGNCNSNSTADHDISRMPWPALVCALMLLSGVAMALAKSRDGMTARAAAASISQLREGTDLLNSRGYFKQVRDQLVFFTGDGKRQMIGLENLALEQVQRALQSTPTQQQEWAVSGTITEFHGTNYLLIRHATLLPQVATRPAMIAR